MCSCSVRVYFLLVSLSTFAFASYIRRKCAPFTFYVTFVYSRSCFFLVSSLLHLLWASVFNSWAFFNHLLLTTDWYSWYTKMSLRSLVYCLPFCRWLFALLFGLESGRFFFCDIYSDRLKKIGDRDCSATPHTSYSLIT